MTATTTNYSDSAGVNLFGVCAAVGRDFGFNPLWLRLAFAVTFLADPVLVAASYFALGAAVLASRIMVRPRQFAAPVAQVAALPVAARTEAQAPLPLAA